MKRFHPKQETTLFKCILFAFFAMATLLLGLLSRSALIPSGTLFTIYGGDILWAAMVYWGIALLVPRKPATVPLISALLFSFSTEFLQLNHAPWLMNLRATTLGALVLGHGFLVSDFICYTLGIGCAFCIDYFMIRIRSEH